MTVDQVAQNLRDIWRSPDPDMWRHVDDLAVVEAIERLCRAVEESK